MGKKKLHARKSVRPTPITYGGWDTETQGGKAVLICTDRAACLFPKSFADCADFLLADGRQLAAFNLAYDARAVMWFLPVAQIAQLNRTTRCVYRGYYIRYIPGKLFTIRKGKHSRNRTVRMWDAWTYFKTSLDKVAFKLFGERKIAIPQWWYENMERVLRNPKLRDLCVDYCLHDAELARRIFQYVIDAMYDAGIVVKQPFSPGSFAVEFFKKDFPPVLPRWVNKVFHRSFYGGRTEIFQRGKVGKTWHYDINSAYPAAYAGMASTEGAQLEKVETDGTPARNAIYGSYLVDCYVDPDVGIPFLPVRYHDLLIYPSGYFRTWVDLASLRYVQAELSSSHRIRILRGSEFCHSRPKHIFGRARELYRLRKRNPRLGLAYKLVLNSTYGKSCASTDKWVVTDTVRYDTPWDDGSFWRRHAFTHKTTHYTLAAHITASCRIQLHKLMMLDPDNLVAVATDGAVFRKPVMQDWHASKS